MANSPMRVIVDVGSVIADTYTIEALIGEGGMGSVFLASHNRLPGKRVAIKLLHAEITDDDVLARFKREAQIATTLGHPNIVEVHDFNITPQGTPYLVLEYLEGETLAQRLTRGPMPLEQVLSIVRQVGSALAAAHREGIVHRDLKPQNIFLVPKDIGGVVVEVAKVLDFGISKIRGSNTVKTQESTLLGTPQYMAPEQAKGDHKSVDERTDVFALGSIVYEMLSGHPAFEGQNIPEVVFKVVYEQPAPLVSETAAVPQQVIAAVTQAMAKPATERFASVSTFVEALTGQPLSLYRPPAARMTGAAGAITPSRIPNTGVEAFANTMGSISPDATASLRKPVLPEAVAPASVVSPKQETVESQSPNIEHAETAKSPPPAHMPRPRRSPFVYVGIAIAAAGLAAAILYFAMRGGSSPSQQTASGSAPITADAAVASNVPPPAADAPAATLPPLVDAAVAAAIDAAPVVAAPHDAGTKKPPVPPVPPPPPPREPDDKEEEATNKQRLQEARAALASGDTTTANVRAQAVINSQDASPRQRAFAAAVAGVLDCIHDDIGGANGWLRRIPGRFSAARQQLAAGCAKHGHPEVQP